MTFTDRRQFMNSSLWNFVKNLWKEKSKYSGMPPGHSEDWYTSLGAKTKAPKKPFSRFVFSVAFQQKICWNSDQWFHNASSCFEVA